MAGELAVENETVVQTKNPILEKPRLFCKPSQEARDTHHAVTFRTQSAEESVSSIHKAYCNETDCGCARCNELLKRETYG